MKTHINWLFSLTIYKHNNHARMKLHKFKHDCMATLV